MRRTFLLPVGLVVLTSCGALTGVSDDDGDGKPATVRLADFPNFDAALGAVSSGGTILVGAGTYPAEQALIFQPVTIRAEEGTSPVIRTDVTRTAFFIAFDDGESGTVLIDGLEFNFHTPTGPDAFTRTYAIRTGPTWDQIHIQNSVFNIDPRARGAIFTEHSTVPTAATYVNNVEINGGQFGVAVDGNYTEVTNSDIVGTASHAMLYFGSTPPSGRVEGNSIVGCGGGNCIRVTDGGNVDIVSNTFTPAVLTGDPNPDVNNVLRIRNGSTVLVENNDFNGCGFHRCIFASGVGTSMRVVNNSFDLTGGDPAKAFEFHIVIRFSTDATGEALNNEITGCWYTCISVQTRSVATISGNTMTIPAGKPTWFAIEAWGGYEAALGVLPLPADAPQVVIENNTIRGLGVPADPGNSDQYEITAGIALINAVATSVTGNVIENAEIGIGSVEGSDLQGGTDNTLTSVFTGIFLGGEGEWDPGTTVLNFNDITSQSAISGPGSTPSNLRCNYWGGGSPLNLVEIGGPFPANLYTPLAVTPIANTPEPKGCTP